MTISGVNLFGILGGSFPSPDDRSCSDRARPLAVLRVGARGGPRVLPPENFFDSTLL
jgi:hypothetical protein